MPLPSYMTKYYCRCTHWQHLSYRKYFVKPQGAWKPSFFSQYHFSFFISQGGIIEKKGFVNNKDESARKRGVSFSKRWYLEDLIDPLKQDLTIEDLRKRAVSLFLSKIKSAWLRSRSQILQSNSLFEKSLIWNTGYSNVRKFERISYR